MKVGGTGFKGPPPNPRGRKRRNKYNKVPLRDATGSVETTTAVAPYEIPKVPMEMSQKNTNFWNRFWTSDLSLATDPNTDMQAITRLFSLYEERDRLDEMYRGSDIILGGEQEEPVKKLHKVGRPKKKRFVRRTVNPVRIVMAKVDGEILRLEDRFGLNPLSRLRLGIVFGQAKKSLADIGNIDSDVSSDTYDPREAELLNTEE